MFEVLETKITFPFFLMVLIIDEVNDACLVINCEYKEPSINTKSDFSTLVLQASISILLATVDKSEYGCPNPWSCKSMII